MTVRVRDWVLTLMLGVAVFGCGPGGEESSKDGGERHVVDRLLVAPPLCALGDESRPGRGCAPITVLPIQKGVVSPELPIRRPITIPPMLVGRDCIVEPMYKGSARGAWIPLTPVLLRAVPAEIEQPFALPEALAGKPVDLWVQVRPAAAPEQTFETPAVAIPRGATLEGGLGIETVGDRAGGSAVEFRLVALTPRGEVELLKRVLEPGPAPPGWGDYRVDLAPVAGESTRFRFSTRVRATPGHDGDDPFRFPLWGAADVIAPAAGGRRRNVILVSLDTLRADHVGVYGCDLPTTPNLDRLASEGAVFARARTVYPATTASHMTMLTGFHPAGHQVVGELASLHPAIQTLAEQLAAEGYRTAAVTENGMVSIASGFARGFTRYREYKDATVLQTSGHMPDVVDTAARWISEFGDAPFFLFVHTYQVHGPYTPPPAFDVFRTYRKDGQDHPITPETPEPIRHRYAYAGEVHFADSEIARLLARLAAAGEAEDTVVVVTSDHGEAFTYDHGLLGHGWNVYEDVLRIPLIVRAPGLVPAGRRIQELVSLVDVVPTVLDLLGIAIPPAVQGASLVPLMRGTDAPAFADRAVFAEVRRGKQRTIACVRDERKWMFETVSGKTQVFDLATDPREQHDLADPALLAEGRGLLSRYEEGNARVRAMIGASAPVAATPDQKTAEKLRALGYVE